MDANVKWIYRRWYLYIHENILSQRCLHCPRTYYSCPRDTSGLHLILLFQHRKHVQKNIMKRNWISDSQIWIRNFELIFILSCETVFYFIRSIRNLSCYFLDDTYDHNIITSSTLLESIILLWDKMPKITFIRNCIIDVDQTLNWSTRRGINNWVESVLKAAETFIFEKFEVLNDLNWSSEMGRFALNY